MASTANGQPAPATAPAPTPPVIPQEPAAAADAAANKRKREPSEPSTDHTVRLSQTQTDILAIVKEHDTEPSFLHHPFSDTHSSEPAHKKQRQSTSGEDKKTTIITKLRDGAYSSLSQLKSDAAHVSKELVSAIRSSEKEEGPNAGRVSVEDLKRIQRVYALEKMIKELADRETDRDQAHASTNGTVKQESGVTANGAVSAPASQNAGGNFGTVLTLFGNAPNPRQLFSSMQRAEETRDPKIKLELPVEEIGLPNGLTATQIMPTEAADAKSGPTFEEAFPAPYSLPSIHPPKGHKRSAVKDTKLNWEFKDPIPRSSKRGGYTTQSLITADWLGYGGVDPAYGFNTPQEKRKQRDRALSGSESLPTVEKTKAQAEAELQKQEEALFRRAFSSFAPSTDNAKSLVPAQTKAMMWYNKIGDRRFNEVFGDDPALVSDSPPDFALDPALTESNANDEDFSKVVEQLDSLPDEVFASAEPDRTNPDEVLRQISELLETLASHQRIRNAVIPSTTSASRTPISPAPTLASKIGKPDAPAEDEINTYNKLRHEIAYLVMKLPPYAVAKVDGDQLSDLGVSKLLPFEARDYQGALEEDEVAKIAKRTAAATAAATASLTRPTSSATGQHYSSSSRTPAIGQAANTRYGQNAATASRTPATAPAYQRSASGQNNYGTPSAAPRPSYAQSNQYARPGAVQQPGYGQANAQQQQYYGGQARSTQPTTNYGSYGQNYAQGTPQTQQRSSFSSSQPLQQFQQRSAQHAAAYQNNAVSQTQAAGTPFKRTASPAMQPTYQAAAQQQRPAYANATAQPQTAQYGQQPASGRATPSYPSQPPTPVNGAMRPAQAPAVPRAASGTPQPINPAQQQPVAQQPNPGLTNGHALHTLSPRLNAPAAMPPTPFIPSASAPLLQSTPNPYLDEQEEMSEALRQDIAASFGPLPNPFRFSPQPALGGPVAIPRLTNPNVATSAFDGGSFPCEHCGKTFMSPYAVNGHKTHSKECSAKARKERGLGSSA